mmetsp:Transcript_1714/g.5362  ORF Transcript_1714/g.5362 Transcript_1714/m.5362 type:complete len:246 (-) Transcript_1714:546-1283(-)
MEGLPLACLIARGKISQVDLLVANRRPELHGWYCNLLRRALDNVPRQGSDRIHVRDQEVVILRGDLHQAFECLDLHELRLLAHAGVQNHVHDDTLLGRVSEVPLCQNHGMVEGTCSLQLCRRVIVPHPLNHSSEDIVGDALIDGQPLLLERHELLAEVAQGDERHLPSSWVLVCDVLQEQGYQSFPFASGNLDRPYLCKHLCCSLSDIQFWGYQSGCGGLLHEIPGWHWQCRPPLFQLSISGWIL